MQDYYEIATIEQLRAVADMLRIRIIDHLLERPMTVTQLGEALGEAPAKIHYHVRELEKAGLLVLVETREKGGILEKYYQPIARRMDVKKDLLSAPLDEVTLTISGWLDQIRDGFLRAYREGLQLHDEQQKEEQLRGLTFAFTRLYLTSEELQQLTRQLEEFCKPFEQRRGIEGERELVTSLLIFPEQNRDEPAVEATPLKYTRAVGVASISRAELEQALAEGRRLRIRVVGICSFDRDISADLAERAIEHVQVIGKIQAPAKIRAVLERKQQPLAGEEETI